MVMNITHLRHNERGMSLVFVCLGLTSFLAATTLAIDVGLLMTSRTQAQNAADAGALAGATALIIDSYDDRSASGPAVQSAINTATLNEVMQETVSVNPSDVTFPLAPTGAPNRVKVKVFRSAARENPVQMLMASMFGVPLADIVAEATAEASPANAATCVAPFTIPDKWIERQTPMWDPDDTFNAFPTNPSTPADIYRPAGSSDYTGYNSVRDKGLRLVIKAGTGNNITPSFYFGLALPTNEGASDYTWNITNCNTSLMNFNQLMVAEPGNMSGPTRQGVEQLIAQDPGAYWDTANKKVVSSMNPSPRVKLVPIFDPLYWNAGKLGGRNADLRAANFIGFFIEGMQGNDVVGRITPISGVMDPNAGPAPVGSFPQVVRLVQ